MRGPIAWPPVPAMTTRSEKFDELVLGGVERVEEKLHRRLADIEVAVEEVPPSDPAPWEERIPLGRAFPAGHKLPARVVLYRRPIESRATGERDLAALVDEVLAEQFASLLGLNPDDLSD